MIQSSMADGFGETENGSLGSSSTLFERKIKFQPARRQFTGFGSADSGDFRIETLNPDVGSKRPAQGFELVQSARKVDGFDFVENGLDPELSLGITFRRIGAGLKNLGNTCFLNSVLQCLTYTEPLAAYLQSGKHQNSCHKAGFCVLCAIQKHVTRALQLTGRSLVPKDLVSNLRCISQNFQNARQEDAHEYMVNLLELMHKCCLPSGVPSESPAAYEKSLVHKIFGGRLRSQVECQQCFYCSNKFDPFLDISLEIAKAESLLVALRYFTAAELLDGGEKHYQCQRCKQKVRAKKRLTVHNAPYVLTIHLKRFHAHDPGRKVDKRVLFDRLIDMKPFVSGSYEGDLKYSLYGVLVHFGHSTHSGHYVCFVRTTSGMWYLLNDNEVRQVSEKTVLDQKAYMLFYVRDRKNIAARKPVDVRKENARAANNVAHLVLKQISKEHADSSSVRNGFHASDSFAAVNQKDALHPAVAKATSQEESVSQQNGGLTMAEFFVRKADPALGNAPSPKDHKGVYDSNPEIKPSLNGNCNTSKLETDMIATGDKTNGCNGALSNSICPQSSATSKLATYDTSLKINLVSSAGVSSKDLSGDPSGKTDEKVTMPSLPVDSGNRMSNSVVPENRLNRHSCESNHGIGIVNASANGDLKSDKLSKNDNVTAHGSFELSTPSTKIDECLHKEANNSTSHQKLKKKLVKCQVQKMRLGSNFFRASLALRKSKKHKKRKCHSLEIHSLIKEHLLADNSLSSELGLSPSKKTNTISSRKSEIKDAKSGLRNGDSARKPSKEAQMDATVLEFRERKNENGAVLAISQDTKELDSAECRKEVVSQNGIMSILTRGLDETTVARWDNVELAATQIVESFGKENFSIGYVLDEWDEEYDRGKRKKLRQKRQFGGQNPFQEISTRKSQYKKAKMDRSSPGNQPFRIAS